MAIHKTSIATTLFFTAMAFSMVAKALGGKGKLGPNKGRTLIRRFLSSVNGNLSYVPRSGDEEYKAVLSDMFRAVKNPSRHSLNSGGPMSNEELFKARKHFFQEMIEKGGTFDSDTTCIIHVAGSKGKGSVVEYLGAALRKEHSVGIFTSPHLHTARERIKIGTELISRSDLTHFGKASLRILSDYPWSVFFDLFLTTAIQYFDTKKPEFVILETGIGGRFDSTNFVERPRVGIITSVSMDHQAVLGETLDLIAWQKAGIIKPGMTVFTPSTQARVVMEVIEKQCEDVGATLHVVEVSQSRSRRTGITALYDIEMQNLCLAQAALEYLEVDSTGMNDFFWPCRMETFEVGGNTIILDGCHNGDSMQLFLEGVRKLYPKRHLRVLFGGGIEKCIEDMLLQVYTHADSVVYLQSGHFKAASEKELAGAMASAGYDVAMPLGCAPLEKQNGGTVERRMKEIVDAKASTSTSLDERPVYVVCGSLFAAAEARSSLYALDPALFRKDDWVGQSDF